MNFTPELLQAESRKYSNAVALILRLDNGRFAVYNARRELQFIAGPTDQLDQTYNRVAQPAPAQQPVAREEIDLDGILGF